MSQKEFVMYKKKVNEKKFVTREKSSEEEFWTNDLPLKQLHLNFTTHCIFILVTLWLPPLQYDYSND